MPRRSDTLREANGPPLLYWDATCVFDTHVSLACCPMSSVVSLRINTLVLLALQMMWRLYFMCFFLVFYQLLFGWATSFSLTHCGMSPTTNLYPGSMLPVSSDIQHAIVCYAELVLTAARLCPTSGCGSSCGTSTAQGLQRVRCCLSTRMR